MTDPTPTPTPHRATPEQWAQVRDVEWNAVGWVGSFASTIEELAARVEALEAQQAQPSQPAATADDAKSGLVEQVAAAIAGWNDPQEDWLPEAQAAIRAVARWLRTEGWRQAPDRLEEEAGR